jgi:hypothetical protein
MLTFALQLVVTACALVFGGIALDVVRRTRGGDAYYRTGWMIAGVAFAVHGIDKAAQNAWGWLALQAGSGSATMAGYLLWAPVFNHSRTFLMLGMCAALAWMCVPRVTPDRRFWVRAWAVMGIGLVAGALVGAQEGGFIPALHMSAVAKWDVVELLVLLGTLFALLLTSRADRHLWSGLTLYASSIAISTFFFTVLAAFGAPGTWTPPTWQLQSIRAVLHLLLVAFALRRWVLARRNAPATGLIDSPRSTLVMH